MSNNALPPADDNDLEVSPTCTAEELAAQRYEAAKAKGDVLELSSDDSEDDMPVSKLLARQEDTRRFFSRLPLREIQKILEFLEFDLVDTAMRSVSKATLAAARLALTCGRWRSIRYVAEHGLAVCAIAADCGLAGVRPLKVRSISDDACATFRKAWKLDPRLTFRVVCDLECSWDRLKEYGAVFLSVVEDSLDGVPRIVAACEDAYRMRSAGSYIIGCDHRRGRDGISYPSHTRERGPYCFPWPMVRAWHEIVLGVELCHNSSRLKESWPLIGAGLEAWADQQLAATFTRDCLYYSTSLNARVDTNLLGAYARTWSARWEDRTKAGAFVAAMGRIREDMVRQYEDDMERRLEQRRMRGEYGSDYDEEESDY